MINEFRDFIMRGNVVDLAVAVVIGAAFGVVVSSFVDDILMQIVAAIFGKPDFSSLTFDLGDGIIRYGSLINAVIAFLSVAAAIFFFVVKPINVATERAKKEDEEAPPAEPPEDTVLLREIRDLLKEQ
ncbi:MAG: large conductance mechanosensitive channel protein MscL [Dehalococcoidia bacterium]